MGSVPVSPYTPPAYGSRVCGKRWISDLGSGEGAGPMDAHAGSGASRRRIRAPAPRRRRRDGPRPARSAQSHACRWPRRCSDTTGRGAKGSGDARARGRTGPWAAGERLRGAGGARGAAPAAPPRSPALFPGEALSAGCAVPSRADCPLLACLRTRVCPVACARALGVGCSGFFFPFLPPLFPPPPPRLLQVLLLVACKGFAPPF